MNLFTSRRKSDGKPRKLRKATHPRALRRQARRIKEAQLGHRLKTGELVHHMGGLTNQKALRVVKGQRSHERIHPGKGH